MRALIITLFAAAFITLLASTAAAAEPDPSLEVVGTGFSTPIFIDAPAGDDRLFVVQKGGTIKVVDGGAVSNFLTISVSGGSEQGLLGMAFHPDYASNGRFFVHYTDGAGDNRIVEYAVSADPNVASTTPVRTIATVDQPYSNHNGGMMEFGPDGKLYVGIGDGGSGGDPLEHGQNPHTRLGAILRFDVDIASPYLPSDNPFASGVSGDEAVWQYGLRNPWRFAHDPVTGELYIGDVGQNTREEVTVTPAGVGGLDLGWNTFEGTFCHEPHPSTGCSTAGTVLPTIEYSHTSGCSGSVTGGYVYRGRDFPDLYGHYFYADYCDGWIKSFRYSGGAVVETHNWSSRFPFIQVTSFGTDGRGELYFTSLGGTLYRIVGTPGPRTTLGNYNAGTRADIAEIRDDRWKVRTSSGIAFNYQDWGAVPAGAPITDLLTGDFTGDGWQDIAAYREGDGTWTVFASTGGGFNPSVWKTYNTPDGWHSHVAGDFNGDGKDDVASFHPSNGTWWVSTSTGSSFTTALWADFTSAAGWGDQLVGDFNGDGRDDIANYHPSYGTWWTSVSTGSGFATGLWEVFSTKAGWETHLVGDFDGDGSDDVTSFHPSNGTWWTSISEGTGFSTSLWADYVTASGWETHLVGDFTGDGKDEVTSFHPSNGTWWTAASDGSGFDIGLWADFTTATGWDQHIAADFNGDGSVDVASHFPGNDSWWVSTSTGKAFTVTRWA